MAGIYDHALTRGNAYQYSLAATAGISWHCCYTHFIRHANLSFRHYFKIYAVNTGGIGCWLLSVVAIILPHELVILLISVAVITAWIVPGYLLRNRYKKQNQ